MLAAIVVTYNRPKSLPLVLDRLLSQPELIRVYVVNNAGPEETGNVLKSFTDHPRVCVITLPENKGGAGGFHAGMKRAMEDADWDWVVLQDDDAWPDEGTFGKLIAKYGHREKSSFAVAALVRHPDGRICEMNRPRRVPFHSFGGFVRYLTHRGQMALNDKEMARRAVPVDMSTFVGLFLTRPALLATGLPDPRFFIYCDDWDYSLRLRKGKIPLIHDPEILYQHDHFSRTGEREPFKEVWKWYYACRNALVLMHRVVGPLAGPIQRYWIAQWRKECLKYPDPVLARKILDRACLAQNVRKIEWPTHKELLEWIKEL